MRQQVSFIADENRMLLLTLIQVHDGAGDLPDQVAAKMCRLQIESESDLAQQIQGRAGGEVHIEHLVKVRVQRGRKDSRRGGLTGANLAGEQSHAGMPDQELEPYVDLLPSRRCEQLLAVRAVGKRRFFEAEEGFPH